jgi:WD40 repeat protein
MLQVKKIHACTGHRAALYALAPGRSERHFLSAGGDGWVVEWDLDHPENGQLIASVEQQLFSLYTLPDRRKIVAGNMHGGLHWIDREAPDRTRNIQHHRKGVYVLGMAGGALFSGGGDGLLTRWDAENARSVESIELSHQALRGFAWSDTRAELAIGASDKRLYLLDADTLALRQTIHDAHTSSVFCAAYAPDGRHLLSGGRDAMLRVWNAAEGFGLESEQPAHWYTINHLVFSPDGTLFATASRDKTLKIWDARTFELLKVIDTLRYGAHARSVNRLLWLPDALVSCGDDGMAMIWQIDRIKT